MIKKKKNSVYPSKTSLNLCIKEQSEFTPVKLLPLLLAVLLLAAAFGKFAVADRLSAVDAAESRLANLEAQRSALVAATEDYDRIYEEYSRYSTSWMSEEELLSIRRTDVLNLVESELMTRAQVGGVTIAGNVLSVQLSGVTLDGVSALVEALYARSDVNNVAVYTASNDKDDGSSAVSMVITLNAVTEGGAEG